ncbi:uncharacterized protein LOC127708960 [Mytilus californianus]|uniref:uncharacterized protein LOC127708960 n=1 Tax=Mytilus californianus TaxID=6549 RepID=UPI0022486186|nr:uncharacterized protein LOC127708960 [Mytilus californianus]
MLDLQTAPYYMQCGGLETSLFDCNYTTDVKGCNITQVAGAICCQGTDKPGECFMNLSPNQVSFEFSTLGLAVGIPAACIAVVCIIVVIVFIRRRSMESNCDKKNRNSLTRNGEESRIQETESYEYTNVASRLSDHTYDPLESTELNCKSKDRKFQNEHKESLTSKSDVSRIRETGFDECPNVASGLSDHTYDPLESAELHCKPIDSNFQNENKESLAGNEEKSKISENCFYESTSVTSRLSDHTYDPIESAEYYNMTNVSVSSAK